MDVLINRETGKPPTENELKDIRRRAVEIYKNPYASPEQLNWAMQVFPEGLADAFLIEPTIYRSHRG